MHDIFISYSSRNREHADALAKQLRGSGYTIWIDLSGIEAASEWGTVIAEAIRATRALILLISRDSLDSHNVLKEVTLASEKRKFIVPVDLEPVELPASFEYPLAGIQRVPYADYEKILHALIRMNSGTLPAKEQRENVFFPPLSPPHRNTTDSRRLAVLPFEDLSPSHDNEWFSDGLTDELIGTLHRLESLFVVDSHSVRKYKQTVLATKDIASELGIRYLITGAVRKAGNNIRVQASLVDAETGNMLWSDKFPGTMDDIFEIQESLGKQIVDGLKVHLSPREFRTLWERGTSNPEAYEYYLRATTHGNMATREDYHEQIGLIAKAIEKDRDYVDAYAILAYAHLMLYREYEREEKHLQETESALEKALSLDPTHAYSLSMRAQLLFFRGNIEGAIESARRAVSLDHRNFLAYHHLGYLYGLAQMHRQAIEAFEYSAAIGPPNPTNYYNITNSYNYLGDQEGARISAIKGLPLYEKYLRMNPLDHVKHIQYIQLLDFAERKEQALSEAGILLGNGITDGSILYNAACVYIRNGEIPRGLELLRSSAAHGFLIKELLTTDPDLDQARSNTEFNRVLEEIGRTSS